MAPPSRTKVRIGVFIPSEVQLLDLACVDFFAMLSHDYLVPLKMLPQSLTDLAPQVTMSYIGTASTVPTTAQTKVLTTHLVSDPDVAPGKLDIIVVPGPDPFSTWSEEARGWLKAQGEREGVDVLSVCTGIFLVGESGLLTKGKTVCGPRGLQKRIREKYEGVKTVGERYRWWQDGNLWTSGGITNGNDLVVAYARQTPRLFPSPVVELVAQMADIGDRSQEYGTGQTVWGLGMAWQLLRAWFMGNGEKKAKTS
ncbi:hypothetical protein GE09DRAFT_1226593 [Coniochaeta sp. 2T2.1]|nr:hypothetical protein GE09DRAFT_1226593 [Coniochaeta sp. 2T2.1]